MEQTNSLEGMLVADTVIDMSGMEPQACIILFSIPKFATWWVLFCHCTLPKLLFVALFTARDACAMRGELIIQSFPINVIMIAPLSYGFSGSHC